jgi:hypothetical protein
MRFSLVIDRARVAASPFDPDPETGSADAEDRDGQQQEPGYGPPHPDRE